MLAMGFLGGANGKEPLANAGDIRGVGLIPGLRRSKGMATHSSILAWSSCHQPWTQPPRYRTGEPSPVLMLQPWPATFSSSYPTYQKSTCSRFHANVPSGVNLFPNCPCLSLPSTCPRLNHSPPLPVGAP